MTNIAYSAAGEALEWRVTDLTNPIAAAQKSDWGLEPWPVPGKAGRPLITLDETQVAWVWTDSIASAEVRDIRSDRTGRIHKGNPPIAKWDTWGDEIEVVFSDPDGQPRYSAVLLRSGASRMPFRIRAEGESVVIDPLGDSNAYVAFRLIRSNAKLGYVDQGVRIAGRTKLPVAKNNYVAIVRERRNGKYDLIDARRIDVSGECQKLDAQQMEELARAVAPPVKPLEGWSVWPSETQRRFKAIDERLREKGLGRLPQSGDGPLLHYITGAYRLAVLAGFGVQADRLQAIGPRLGDGTFSDALRRIWEWLPAFDKTEEAQIEWMLYHLDDHDAKVIAGGPWGGAQRADRAHEIAKQKQLFSQCVELLLREDPQLAAIGGVLDRYITEGGDPPAYEQRLTTFHETLLAEDRAAAYALGPAPRTKYAHQKWTTAAQKMNAWRTDALNLFKYWHTGEESTVPATQVHLPQLYAYISETRPIRIPTTAPAESDQSRHDVLERTMQSLIGHAADEPLDSLRQQVTQCIREVMRPYAGDCVRLHLLMKQAAEYLILTVRFQALAPNAMLQERADRADRIVSAQNQIAIRAGKLALLARVPEARMRARLSQPGAGEVIEEVSAWRRRYDGYAGEPRLDHREVPDVNDASRRELVQWWAYTERLYEVIAHNRRVYRNVELRVKAQLELLRPILETLRHDPALGRNIQDCLTAQPPAPSLILTIAEEIIRRRLS